MTIYEPGLVGRGRRPDAPLAPGLVPTARAHRANPLCGDDITVEIVLDNGTVAAVGYWAHGCTFVRASASLLVELGAGLTPAQALDLGRQLTDAVHCLGKLPPSLAELGGVHLLPARRRCALLPWEAFAASLEGQQS
jgi:nitrogen fixation NifU-like protein